DTRPSDHCATAGAESSCAPSPSSPESRGERYTRPSRHGASPIDQSASAPSPSPPDLGGERWGEGGVKRAEPLPPASGRPLSQSGGKGNMKTAIVNISSMVGRRGIPGRSEYCASKFAVQGFSEALRAELAIDNIDVFVINPGLTQTNFPGNMIERKSRFQV